MFGLTFEKLVLIGVVAVFLLGPDRLPHYAAVLGRVVRQLRMLASGASDRLRDEMGPDFDDVDWKKYDPRKYDPRRIIRDVLLDAGDVAPHVPSPPRRPSADPLSPSSGAADTISPVPAAAPPESGPPPVSPAGV
ncbi:MULTISPECIES: twin-arginine translocase TatA/TatE family subunit [unclassified Cryobacterium]|nr:MULTISPECIES: twin-arginine translocase TatA/TatE family subunit [Cryobacterium]MDY7526381.1 twin-arginine translocase TatA/TatE family subunit [Cryobacterium sp. 10C2]MEB0203437.1 twin-arginine translocase TatA/TatE family subunit [Cryobacterium sp. 5I3]MEB0287747.1 twin-arginine translocase TatA/TatE family subunit [Cryobacterium sp. 10S3]MEB0292408.1 twin-arginine translocase TatA/TatE family subunit [Cryobacterium sp. 10C2]MEB0305718.1 twin-arginine translocase TatA/TatE family subunit 